MDKDLWRLITGPEAQALERMGWEVCGSGAFAQKQPLGYVYPDPSGLFLFAKVDKYGETREGEPRFDDPISAAVYGETLV